MAALARFDVALKSCGEGCFVPRSESASGGCAELYKAGPTFCATSAPASRSKCYGKLESSRLKPSISSLLHQYHPFSTKALQPSGVFKARALKERFTDEVFAATELDDSNAEDPFKNASFLLPEDLERRPRARGFGQGKAYDTSVEETLLAEIEASTTAGKKKRQGGDAPVVARNSGSNGKRSKPPPPPAVDHKGPFPWLLRGTPDDRYPLNTPAGVKVTLGNLPKKKKVGRDLQRALVAVPGLLVIRPKEEGDRNTRDCTCMGSATLIFKDKQYALGFCTGFQGRPMQFGKIERRITAKLADQRQQPPQQTPGTEDDGVEDEGTEDREADEVDEMIEEGKEQGAEQLKRQNRLEEDKGRQALLEGVPQVDEAELQEATVKTPREDDDAPENTAAAPAPPSVEWAERVDEEVRHGQEEGAAQTLEQRRKEETEGTDSLLGTHHTHAKEGEDGRSAALSGSVEGRDARGGLTLAGAVQRGEAAGEDEVDIDDLFDEADLEDEALDDDGEETDDEGGVIDDDESDKDQDIEMGMTDSASDAAPRSSRVTKLLDDGTLIVKGQEVGRIDPALVQDGQLKVPKEVAERIASLTGGQPIEVDLVTDEALRQKRAFEEKLRAWHFGQLPGFQGAEQPANEEGAVTWDRAKQTMVRGATFDKAKHKRMKKEAREPQSLQEMARERQTEQGGPRSGDQSDDGSEWEDEVEEEEWELDESDDDADEGEPGASARASKGGVVRKVDYRELLAAEKRELAAGKARLKGRGETVAEPSPEVLELMTQLNSNPDMFDDEDDEEATGSLRRAGSSGSMNGARESQAQSKHRGRQEGEGQRREGSQERHRSGDSRGKKSQGKRPGKPEYGKLISDLRQSM